MQPVAIALSGLLASAAHLAGPLEMLVDSRAVEISAVPFPDLDALAAHAQSTAGALMQIAASLLDPRADTEDHTQEAGTAYGLSGILRALPFHAARGRNFLPADLMAAEGLSPEGALSARDKDAIRNVVSKIAAMAKEHFARARRKRPPRRVLPAVLPAALVPASLGNVTRRGRDPLRDVRDLSLLRRQLILVRAAALGRL